MLDCACSGAIHIVCKRWKVPTAERLRLPGYVPNMKLGEAVAQGLVVKPYDTRWNTRDAISPGNYWRSSTRGSATKCPQCRSEGWIIDSHCLTCFGKMLREQPMEATT